MTDLAKKLNTRTTDVPVCPHCGYEVRDVWEIDFGPGLDGDTDIDCGRCGKTFFAQRLVSVSYTTSEEA